MTDSQLARRLLYAEAIRYYAERDPKAFASFLKHFGLSLVGNEADVVAAVKMVFIDDSPARRENLRYLLRNVARIKAANEAFIIHLHTRRPKYPTRIERVENAQLELLRNDR